MVLTIVKEQLRNWQMVRMAMIYHLERRRCFASMRVVSRRLFSTAEAPTLSQGAQDGQPLSVTDW